MYSNVLSLSLIQQVPSGLRQPPAVCSPSYNNTKRQSLWGWKIRPKNVDFDSTRTRPTSISTGDALVEVVRYRRLPSKLRGQRTFSLAVVRSCQVLLTVREVRERSGLREYILVFLYFFSDTGNEAIISSSFITWLNWVSTGDSAKHQTILWRHCGV